MQLGIYRHYKNKDHLYRVLSLALGVEAQNRMVVYQALYDVPDLADSYGIRPVFVRPYEIFTEFVEHDGQHVSRFQYVGD